MKSVIVIIITVVIVVLGLIVGITLLLGRGKSGSDATSNTLSLGKGATLDGGIFITGDAGETWKQKVLFSDKATLGGLDINDIVFDPASSSRIFVATTGNGLFQSVVTGTTDWVRVKDEKGVLTDITTVHQIAFDPSDSKYVYLAVEQGGIGKVLKSEDGGKSFKEMYQTPKPAKGASAVYSVAVDQEDTRRVYIGTFEGGVLASQNRGESWTVVNWFGSPVRRIFIHPQDSNFIYVTFIGKDLSKIQRSFNRGASWEQMKVTPPKGKSIQGIYGLTFHPSDANVLYLATNAGVFKTPDAGATWIEFPLIIPPALLPVFTVAVNPENPDIIYVAAATQIYKSKDGGVSWEVRKMPTTKNIRILMFSPKSRDELWAGLRK